MLMKLTNVVERIILCSHWRVGAFPSPLQLDLSELDSGFHALPILRALRQPIGRCSLSAQRKFRRHNTFGLRSKLLSQARASYRKAHRFDFSAARPFQVRYPQSSFLEQIFPDLFS